jgi:hypothetical protein
MLKLYGHDHSLVNCYGMFVHVCKMIVDMFISSFMTYYTNTTTILLEEQDSACTSKATEAARHQMCCA